LIKCIKVRRKSPFQMQSRPNNNQFHPFIETVEKIVSAMKVKERHIEELNTSDFSDDSQNIRIKLQTFQTLFASAKEPRGSDNKAIILTDKQKQILEKAVEDANLGIESHSLKVIRNSIKELESFREQITNS